MILEEQRDLLRELLGFSNGSNDCDALQAPFKVPSSGQKSDFKDSNALTALTEAAGRRANLTKNSLWSFLSDKV